METLIRDVRYAFRTLARMRALAVMASLTLGLGIAATTTMFSVVHAVLLRPLPFDRPNELVILYVTRTTPRDGEQRVRWSWAESQTLVSTLTSFDSLGTFTSASINLTGGGAPEQVDSEIVSPGYLRVLRIAAERGRLFVPGDASAGAPPVALISADLWRRRFGSDPAIVGRSIGLNEVPLNIIGVLSDGFAGLTGRATVWLLPTMAPTLTYAGYLTTPQHFINVVGRLRDGISLARANAELAAVATRVVAPEASAGPSARWGAVAWSLSAAHLDAKISRQALTLLAAVGCVLLITCVNIASLLLARGRSRRREIAVRLAIGSGRSRIVGQLLAESLVLALLGGLVGVILTLWSIDLVAAPIALASPSSGLPQLGAFATPAVDANVLLFALVATLGTAVFCGLVPALEMSRVDLVTALKDDARSGTARGHGRVLGTFVVTELAVAVLLLIVAGLLIRSFADLQELRAGFVPDGVVTFWVRPPASRYAPADGPLVVQEVLAAVQRAPGVVSATVNRCAPFDLGCARTTVFLPERPVNRETAPLIGRHYVSADYFRTLGMSLRTGRVLTDDDRAGRPPVAVINETAARLFWPGENPVGKHVWFGGGTGFADPSQQVAIVGIVADVKYGAVEDPATADFYTSYLQFTYPDTMVLVKTAQPLRAIVPALRTAVASVDPDLPIHDLRALDERIAGSLARPRLAAMILGAFALAALILAAIGVYGVMAYSVMSRRREIGIRMALGADRTRVLKLVLAEGARLTFIGASIGLAAALAVTRFIRAMLFGVAPTDPVILGTVLFLTIIVALASAGIPARRASSVDPITVLRID